MNIFPFLNKVAESGLLGVLLVLSLITNYFLLKGWLGEKDKRIVDAQAVTDKISKPLDTIQATLNSFQTLLQSIVNNKS